MLSVGPLSTLFTDNPVKNIDTEKVLNRIPQITWIFLQNKTRLSSAMASPIP